MSSNANVTVGSRGPGFLGLLQLALIILKLGEFGVVADWSWWVVLIPLYVIVAIYALIIAAVVWLAHR